MGKTQLILCTLTIVFAAAVGWPLPSGDLNKVADCGHMSASGIIGGIKALNEPFASMYSEDVMRTGVVPLLSEHLVRVVCATRQVVSGEIISLQVQVANDESLVVKRCSFIITNQSWLKNGTNAQIRCEGDNSSVVTPVVLSALVGPLGA